MRGVKYNIVFFPMGLRGQLPTGITVLEAAMKLGADVSSICGGEGSCGKCKIIVDKGLDSLGPFTESELKYLTKEEMQAGYRLACSITIPKIPQLIIRVPERSRVGKQRLQTDGLEVPTEPMPYIKKYYAEMAKGTLEDPRSDEDRLLDALNEQRGLENLMLPHEVATYLPIVMRQQKFTVTAVVYDGREIIAVEPGDTTDENFGFACDVGSTKLAGFLMDLNSGKVVAISSRMNPQIPYGEDVLSRITYAKGGLEKLATLQKVIIEGINEMILECCEEAKVRPEEIYEGCFVGNTAMHHLFLGIWPKFVAFSPYPPAVRRGVRAKGANLEPGLTMHQNAHAYFLPTIGGFVGADQIGVELAIDILNSDELMMELDIGTNTEIALGDKNGVMCVSCASGPAFEGMHIAHGMRAATGSIEKITIDPVTLEVNYRSIEDAKPVGICGSGLIDVLAEFVKAGIIDFSGRMNSNLEKLSPRMRKGAQGYEFVIAPKEETATGTDIGITQDDVRELQKAKAAMHAGCEILMLRRGVTEEDIDKLVIAGAFGQYIDPENARTMGMYPEVSLDKVWVVGNAAGTGARMALISKKCREYAEFISKKVEYYELAIDPDFVRVYANSMYVPNRDLSKYPDTAELLKRLGRVS